MAGLTPCSAALVSLALVGPPALPPDRDGASSTEATGSASEAAPAEPVPAEAAPAEPVPAEPVPAEPVPAEPSSYASTPGAPVVSATDDEVAPRSSERAARDAADQNDPVERFEPGQWGMQFTFGGLAPMSVAGVRDFGVNRLTFTEIGFRRVFGNNWMVPFSVGAGVFNHSPDEGESQNDVGLAASVGVQRYFRVWRRIAPYAGGRFRLHYSEPNGRANWMVGIALGPVLGIEYFVGHRVSLSMQGTALLGIGVFSGLLQIEAATQLDAGGQMGLTFYF
ncbi:MAG: hypothetical protein AAGF11_04485 [Myxococcota bacterium]